MGDSNLVAQSILLIPGMGTGIGDISSKQCAHQMKMAIDDIVLEKYYSKCKCIFNVNTHSDLINNLRSIEEKLLKKLESVKRSQRRLQNKC